MGRRHHPGRHTALARPGRWDADAVRDDVREYVPEHLHDEAAVPAHVRFATKPALGLQMLGRAIDAGLPRGG